MREGPLCAQIRDGDGATIPDADVEWSSLDDDVASVDVRGVVEALGVGTARIRAGAGGKGLELVRVARDLRERPTTGYSVGFSRKREQYSTSRSR